MALSTIPKDSIAADAIDGTKIADDAVSEEHLDNTALTGFSELSSLADADKFLVSDASDSSNIKYVQKSNMPSGALSFISSAGSTSNHSAITMDNIFSATFENYLILGDISQQTNNNHIRLQMRTSSGSLSGSDYSYRFSRQHTDSNDQSLTHRSTGNTYFQLTDTINNNANLVGYAFMIYIFDPLSTGKRMSLIQQACHVKGDEVQGTIVGAGQYEQDDKAITGLTFFPNSDNFTNSTIRVYGLSNS